MGLYSHYDGAHNHPLAWLGHLIEGNKPAFLNNPMHVFVAPLWMARKILGMTDKKSA